MSGKGQTKYTYEEVKQIFEDKGCQLLSTEYIDCDTSLNYICNCGTKSQISFYCFTKGSRCKECGIKKRIISGKANGTYKGSPKYTLEDAKRIFAAKGCELLSTEYKACNQKMQVRCACGAINQINLQEFNNRPGLCCRSCFQERIQAANKRNHGGVLFTKTEEYKEKCKKTCLDRYGVEFAAQSPEIKDRIQKTIFEKYGVTSTTQIPEIKERQLRSAETPEAIKKHEDKMIKKYGVPYCPASNKSISKESKTFFSTLYETLPDNIKDGCMFSPLNSEFTLQKKRYDFAHCKLKKCIEYNGSVFHPRPDLKDEDIGWHLYYPNKTAKIARDKEAAKAKVLTDHSFELLVVWDYESNTKTKLVQALQKCLDFLLKEKTEEVLVIPEPLLTS